jgi:hypothetical protein
MPYFAARNLCSDLGSIAASSCQVNNCNRLRRTQLLTPLMTEYHFSIRSGRLASHKTQKDPPVAWAASTPRINPHEGNQCRVVRRCTGLTSTDANFSGNGFTHLQLLRKTHFEALGAATRQESQN